MSNLQVKDGAGATKYMKATGDGTDDSNAFVPVQSITGTVTVNGSGVTQPVSASALPLPTGAATAAKQPALGTAGSASSDVITVQGVTSMTPLKTDGSGVTQPVSGTVTIQDGGNTITVDGTVNAAQSGTWNVTNISGTVSLPTGAATAAKQPALGTAGSASADVITVQGVASMTPLKADSSPGTPAYIISANSTNATVLKNGPGVLNGFYLANVNAADRWVKFYNKATTPTVGTDLPVLIFRLPRLGSGIIQPRDISFPPGGIEFSAGISYALTTGQGVADTGAVAAGEIDGSFSYR